MTRGDRQWKEMLKGDPQPTPRVNDDHMSTQKRRATIAKIKLAAYVARLSNGLTSK